MAVLALATLGFEHEASAQPIPANNGDGFDTHLFRPALDSKGFFHTNGTDILGKNDLSFGLVIDYGRGLLRTVDKGQESANLIDHSFQGTFSFNYGIANLLVAGLTLPMNLASGQEQFSNRLTPPGPTQVGPIAGGGNGTQWGPNVHDFQNVSFLALHAKMRILRVERGFGLAEEGEQGTAGRMDAYERLLGDAMLGDATLFARQDVVEAAWAIVDPVIKGPSPMYDYDPGTWGPTEADRLVESVGGWNMPRP